MEKIPQGPPQVKPVDFYYNGYSPHMNGAYQSTHQEYQMYDRDLRGTLLH